MGVTIPDRHSRNCATHWGDKCNCLHGMRSNPHTPRPLGPELPDFTAPALEPAPEPAIRPLMERVVTPPEWGAILDSIAFKGMLFVCFEKAGVCVMTKEGTFVKLVPEAAHVTR